MTIQSFSVHSYGGKNTIDNDFFQHHYKSEQNHTKSIEIVSKMTSEDGSLQF